MSRIRLALCQVNTVVGDVDGNVERVLGALSAADDAGCDVVAFPELALTGYPPEDLLLKPAFVYANLEGLEKVAAQTSGCVAVVGFVDVLGATEDKGSRRVDEDVLVTGRDEALRGAPRRLRNAAAVCSSGEIVGVYHKRLLPNYGVFDEERWFAPGTGDPFAFEVAGVRVGVSVCEDLWFADGPAAELGAGGAELIVNINASPYSVGRRLERLLILEDRVAETGCAIAYVNQVGGQDELVFDGGSIVMDAHRSIVSEAPPFSEELLIADLEVESAKVTAKPLDFVVLSSTPRDPEYREPPRVPEPLGREAEIYEALRLGTHDYLYKNRFTDAVIGLSGGIDSSLVAAVAVDALGASHVHGFAMPSRYSSPGSVTDATELAFNLGIDLEIVPIEEAHGVFAEMLVPVLGDDPAGLTDENLQSRIRGVILMAVTNARPGWIVLTTGNKSEIATGYSTLYGDSAGGFAVIRDVPKTVVYDLCRYRNALAGRALIPESVLEKPPSAELRPDQRDDQSLPPYEVLDPVLEALVEKDESVSELVSEGVDRALAARVASLVDGAEYKRRQFPPGVRITARAFGKDRRMPITNRFREPDRGMAESGTGE
jgi:NAD+ synthase (glutamine-hydrolysing)